MLYYEKQKTIKLKVCHVTQGLYRCLSVEYISRQFLFWLIISAGSFVTSLILLNEGAIACARTVLRTYLNSSLSYRVTYVLKLFLSRAFAFPAPHQLETGDRHTLWASQCQSVRTLWRHRGQFKWWCHLEMASTTCACWFFYKTLSFCHD